MAETKTKVKQEPKTTSLIFSERQEPQESYSEKYKEKLVQEVFSKEDAELKSDLNDAEIIALTKADIFAEYYDSSLIEKLKRSFLLLKVSKKRQGRGEFVKIAQAVIAPQQEEQPTIPERLFGGR